MYFIYRYIRLDINQPFYIGFGTKGKSYASYRNEYRRAFSMSGRSKYFKNIIKKIDFEVEIIFESDNKEEVIQKEIEFIKLYGRKDLNLGTLVNLTDGGESVNLSLISREKMSIAKKGKKRLYSVTFSDAHRKTISEMRKTKIGNLNHFYGKKHTEETRIKRSIPVIQYDLQENFIEEFYGMTPAAIKTGSLVSLIEKVCKGQRKTHNNFIWKYKTHP